MSDGHVRPAARIVGLQLQALVVGDDCLLTLAGIRQSRPQLVPNSRVIWSQSAGSSQSLHCRRKVSVDVFHDAQGYEDVRVGGADLRCSLEELGHLPAPEVELILRRRLNSLYEALILLVVLQPCSEVAQSWQLIQLVCAADTQGQKTVQVVGIHLVTSPQALNCLDILIELCVELAQHPPSFRALWVALDLALQAQERFSVPTFPDEPDGFCKRVRDFTEGILLLKLVLLGPVHGRQVH
mmetsp:Transcript_6876/g.15945  ORF Transcript_6876/g.15945 Transcript_6876/m.15945 type:complete len:240 (-) Transcript_6876:284-1003(-)